MHPEGKRISGKCPSTLTLLSVLLLLPALPAQAQSAANVLLVINDSSPDSTRIGESYSRVRGIAQDAIVHVKIDPADQVSRADFEGQLYSPIMKWLGGHSAQDRILYIVLTKGIPLRVIGTTGRNGTVASVDSELALTYRRMTGAQVAIDGHVDNPYFLGEASIDTARPFSHQEHDIYLVTRLDGFTVDDVLRLIDRGAAPTNRGRILLDERASWQDPGNTWLQQAADWLKGHGFGDRVMLETTSRVLTNQADVIGYYSWGSNDPAITERHLGLKFLPGAIGASFVSTDARTFKEPPADWKTGSWDNPNGFFERSPQSLAGDLVRDGITGVAGQVAEPYLDATIRPNVLFPAYVSGFNLAESFYLAMPYLSWQTIVVGDPLCAPFPGKRLSVSDIDKGTDEVTELPALFAKRRLREVLRDIPSGEAAAAFVKAEARLARDDKAGAREALEGATKLQPRAVAAQLKLASLYDDDKEYEKAIERYKQVLSVDSANVIALNNLAYATAVGMKQPAEARPYAERAYLLSGRTPTVADTLGWVYHLTGDDAKAGPVLTEAARQLPDSGEVHLHLAVVLGAVGMLEGARKELETAVKLDPTLETSDEVKRLRARLK